MWDNYGEYASWKTSVALANYVPGPLNPPDYYWTPGILPCGCSEEDCDGTCENAPLEVPAGYDDASGVNVSDLPVPWSSRWRE